MIDNARLFEAAQAGQNWLRASAAITCRLLAPGDSGTGDTAGALQLIAENFREVARADLVTVLLPTTQETDGADATHLRVHTIVGDPGIDDLLDRTFPDRVVPVSGSLSGAVFATGEPRRIGRPGEAGSPRALGAEAFDVGPLIAVPLQGSRRRHGVLTAARRHGRADFDDTDLEMAAGFASQTSVAIELAEARAEQLRAAMLDDRDRIAADLHDHVIQRLFATGLSLQGLAIRLGGTPDSERVHAAIAELDTTISQIRTSIFDLHTRNTEPVGVRDRLIEVATDLSAALGFTPQIHLGGPLEHLVPDDVAHDLLAVSREALSNVARHAGAQSVVLAVTVASEQLCLEVTDDGVAIGATDRSSGLGTMRRRAERHGGTLHLAGHDPTGTRLTWTVPLSPACTPSTTTR